MRKIWLTRWISVLLAGALALGTALYPAIAANPAPAPSATVAVEWMDLITHLIKNEAKSPPQASRIIAYAGVTAYEAACPGIGGYQSLSGQLNDMPAMPQPQAGNQYDWSASLTAAMSAVLNGLFDSASSNTTQAILNLSNQQLQARNQIPVDVLNRSVVYGQSIAEAILSWAGQDGYQAARGLPYSSPQGPGMWVPTPPAYAPPLEPYWGQLRTFAILSADSCVPPTPMMFSTENISPCYQQALVVYQAVKSLNTDSTTIANFWADDAGKTYTPPGHWLSIENQVVQQLNLSLDRALELYAIAGVAMGDAFISCWHAKFQYCLLRPITYINAYIDSGWQPLLITPPFPEYTSGHSVVSGAVSTVLSQMLGKLSFVDKTYADVGVPSRQFNSFEAAANEAAISRLYAGIHYPLSIQYGVFEGQMVGQAVLDRLQTRK